MKSQRLMRLQEIHTVTLQDLMAKAQRADWHGVADAANDLRVLEERVYHTNTEGARALAEVQTNSLTCVFGGEQ